MGNAQLIRVTAEGTCKMVSFSSEHINRIETARQIGWQLTELIDSDQTAIDDNDCLNLDFKNINWISSVGLNELIGINSLARSHGIRVVLVDVPQSVRDIFAITRLERMFEFSKS